MLRPLHRYFFFWEDRVPSLYRVIAVAVGAGATTGLLRAAGARRLWVVAPASLFAWVLLGVVQEHDERVPRPLDEEFAAALRDQVDGVLSAAGFRFVHASGGSRARGGTVDVFLYEVYKARYPHLQPGGDHGGCLDLWIRRDIERGVMEVSIGYGDLAQLLDEQGLGELARRVRRAEGPEGDAAALAEALAHLF